MCIVIDANKFGSMLDSTNAGLEPVRRWLTKQDGKAVYGGTRYLAELAQSERMRKLFIELDRAGRAWRVKTEVVDADEKSLPKLRSNDGHVIALVRVSGARSVVTDDQLLIDDLHDKALVPPAGARAYKTAQHDALLCHSPTCRKTSPSTAAKKRTRRRRRS